MKKAPVAFIAIIIFITSCSKDGKQTSGNIAGTWIFTNRQTISYAYPSVLTNPTPIGTSAWNTTSSDVKITFDNNGSYSFSNFTLPVDIGKYVIARDSFLIIRPDTAGFVKFNYTLMTVTSSTGPVPVPVPLYADFKFSSDTILFKKVTNDNIVFSGVWLTKAYSPILPGNDTLILNQSFNYFKKQ